MNRLTKQYKDTKRYYSTHSCDEVLQKLGKLEDKEEYKPTEEEIIEEFERIGYKCVCNSERTLILEKVKIIQHYPNKMQPYTTTHHFDCIRIEVWKNLKHYIVFRATKDSINGYKQHICHIAIKVHQLLHKLIELWGWFE